MSIKNILKAFNIESNNPYKEGYSKILRLIMLKAKKEGFKYTLYGEKLIFYRERYYQYYIHMVYEANLLYLNSNILEEIYFFAHRVNSYNFAVINFFNGMFNNIIW
jgi:hypothetical protein